MDITAADLSTELAPNSPELALLREIARFRGPGAILRDLPVYDLGPVYDLAEAGLITVSPEPMGTFSGYDGSEDYATVAHLTEHGLEELVVHGRER